MSTLGDLRVDHTMLPGNAVDHLHAVVGEWQLLADLSFADYLMWVRRDDGVLVCVAQCRPNTAPTVLQTDAVGSAVSSEQLALVAETFASGIAKRNDVAGQQNPWLPGTHVEASRCGTAARWWPYSRIIRLRWPPTARPVSWRSPTDSAPATLSTCL